jgi:glucans biosynthesis protein
MPSFGAPYGLGPTRRQVFVGLSIAAAAGRASAADQAFGDDAVPGLARALAARPYAPPSTTLPPALAALDYDAYRQIRFRPERSIWGDRPAGGFRLQTFHRGGLFREAVQLHEVEGGRTRPIPYQHDLFRFDGGDPGRLPAGLGYAGFRIHAPINRPDYFDEVAAFLGASYFRAVARGGLYGLSARGLSLGSGEPGEEFPRFSDFWIERPSARDRIVVHALLDSPSVAGAYRFEIQPGEPTRFDVTARLYPRRPIVNAGIAPLTSMFLFAPGRTRRFDDFRPEVHDSDGLLIRDTYGNRTWRALGNPTNRRMSIFQDHPLAGFGLMQRTRRLEAYSDFEARYDLRPSAWVEPLEGFDAGSVMLAELPTPDETEDNIVAFWRPARPLEPGREHRFRYRLNWGADPSPQDRLARLVDWSSGQGGVPGKRGAEGRRRFVLDFAGAPKDATPSVQAQGADVLEAMVHPWPEGDRVRISFEVQPTGTPIELRASLSSNAGTVSETWAYRLD